MRSFAIWAISLAVVVTVQGMAQGPTLEGAVSDNLGARIVGAFVLAHPDFEGSWTHDGRHNLEASTDKQGRFALPLATGFWDVCVMADAFLPRCEKIRVKEGKRSRMRVVLTVSPEVTPFIGDTVQH